MNIDLKFEQGLRNTMESPSVKRVDFCVGCFNLRGWKLIIDQVDNLPGDYVGEGNDDMFRTCRLLIGMHHHNEDYIRRLYGQDGTLPEKVKVAESYRFSQTITARATHKTGRVDIASLISAT